MEVEAVDLAGRGEKSNRHLYTSFDEAVNDLYNDISKKLDTEPYGILGHSMGSWIAYELYYKLKSCNQKLPKHIFFSGNVAPPVEARTGGIHRLPEEQFSREIVKLGYTPQKIFDIDRIRHLFLPMIKADLTITETYISDKGREPLECDITVLNGKEDPVINQGVEGWSEITNKECKMIFFPGNHFFIYEHTDQIGELIYKVMRGYDTE